MESWLYCGVISSLREGVHDTHPFGREVQLGEVTLRLNRWCFRAGYENGQADYEQGQHERSSCAILSAQELLRYVAHYDSDTDLYLLGDEELCTIEETLGQLIGYLCSALFFVPVRTTEPLPSQGMLHEA